MDSERPNGPAFDGFAERTIREAKSFNDQEVLTLADNLHDLLRDRRGGVREKHRYAVVMCGTEWRVISRRGRIGHFDDWNDAFAFCGRLAREAAETGHDVEFLVQSDSGELLPI